MLSQFALDKRDEAIGCEGVQFDALIQQKLNLFGRRAILAQVRGPCFARLVTTATT